MSKEEFMKGIHILQDAYNQKFSTDKLKLWYENLKEINANTYLDRINQLIKVKDFMPNIAEILNKNKVIDNFEQRAYNNYDFKNLYTNIKR